MSWTKHQAQPPQLYLPRNGKHYSREVHTLDATLAGITSFDFGGGRIQGCENSQVSWDALPRNKRRQLVEMTS